MQPGLKVGCFIVVVVVVVVVCLFVLFSFVFKSQSHEVINAFTKIM